jgi:hypothetical protein
MPLLLVLLVGLGVVLVGPLLGRSIARRVTFPQVACTVGAGVVVLVGAVLALWWFATPS